MIHTRKIRRPVEVPQTLQCNACGRSWSLDENPRGDLWAAQEVEEFTVTGGYGNHQWGDCIRLLWHACPDCVAAWIETFAIKPAAFELSLAWGSKPLPVPFRFYGRPGQEENED